MMQDWPRENVQGAQRERTLVWLSAWQPRETEKVRAAFVARFPFVDLQAICTTHPFERMAEERRTGKPTFDTAGPISGTSVAHAAQQGMFASYVSPLMADLDQVFYDPKGHWYSTHSMGMCIAYNRDSVGEDQVPRSYADLLEPRWKGRILMEDIRDWGTSAEWATGVHREFGEAYFQSLAAQDIQWYVEGAITGSLNQVTEGKHAIAPWSVDYMVQLRIDNGEPLGWTNPLRLGRVPANVIMANAPHPYAARLFADWLMSDEGQALIGQENLGFPARPGMPCYMAQFYPPDVRFKIVHPADVAKNKAMLIDMYNRVFFGA